jgi:Na+/alanine symporter
MTISVSDALSRRAAMIPHGVDSAAVTIDLVSLLLLLLLLLVIVLKTYDTIATITHMIVPVCHPCSYVY